MSTLEYELLEGFYCANCFAKHGTYGTDEDRCLNCGEHSLVYIIPSTYKEETTVVNKEKTNVE